MAETGMERVKAALIAEDESVGGTRHAAYWDDMARAAIEAMREPTEAMLEAGMAEEGTDLASEYRAMIDTLLKEEGNG